MSMSDETNAWATGLGLSAEQVEAFKGLATAMALSPPDIIGKMVVHVLAVDREMRNHGLHGIPGWITPEQAVEVAVDRGLEGLSMGIRPSNFMWPADKPFPWSAEECKAAVIGYEVQWHGNFDDFLNCLRGKWEMSDGYAFLHQT
jgi:hypothetical protein